ncbi:MAG: response regulator [Treponema sp.]|mgnify:CR=1 FL=1|nr:response regulator [Treponema sp.]
MAGDTKPTVYSALEAARICGVVNQTSINWIKSGFLKAFKTPGGQFRVYPDDLADFMQSRNMAIPSELLEACTRFSGKKTLLIVDDDRGLNTVIKHYIQKKLPNWEIFQAFDGFEAGSIMTEKKPACIVLDLDLPGINGVDLCKKIKEDEKFGNPKIIIVTALENKETEMQVKSLGIQEFIKKPIDLVELEGFISQE